MQTIRSSGFHCNVAAAVLTNIFKTSKLHSTTNVGWNIHVFTQPLNTNKIQHKGNF